jgi:hypothetical protein
MTPDREAIDAAATAIAAWLAVEFVGLYTTDEQDDVDAFNATCRSVAAVALGAALTDAGYGIVPTTLIESQAARIEAALALLDSVEGGGASWWGFLTNVRRALTEGHPRRDRPMTPPDPRKGVTAEAVLAALTAIADAGLVVCAATRIESQAARIEELETERDNATAAERERCAAAVREYERRADLTITTLRALIEGTP